MWVTVNAIIELMCTVMVHPEVITLSTVLKHSRRSLPFNFFLHQLRLTCSHCLILKYTSKMFFHSWNMRMQMRGKWQNLPPVSLKPFSPSTPQMSKYEFFSNSIFFSLAARAFRMSAAWSASSDLIPKTPAARSCSAQTRRPWMTSSLSDFPLTAASIKISPTNR